MKRLRTIVFLGLCFAAAAAQGQTRYVSDQLVITFRTGPSTQNAVTRNLTSGDRVQVLEELPEEGFSRVRLDDGEEGWVLTRYLQPERTAELLLEEATRELDAAERSVATLEGRVTTVEASLESTQEELAQAQNYAARLEAELADITEASASAIATRDQNESLRLRVSEMTAAADLSEMEIRELRSRNRQSWFIVGAAVLFGGIVIGLVAPSLRRKRRSSW